MSCVNVITLETEMSDHLVNTIIDFVFPIVIIIHDFIRRSLWIDDNKGSVDAEVKLGLCETGIFGDIFGIVIFLFIDDIDFRLVGDLGFFGSLFDPKNILVGGDTFPRRLTNRSHMLDQID